MKRNTTRLLTGILATAFASTASAQDPSSTLTAEADADAEAEVELEDDILLVLDLPLVALQLVEEQEYEQMEVAQIITTMEVAGIPASETTEVIEGESEAAQERGKRPGFGAWVARRVAAGDRGKVIRELAKMRGEKDGEVTDEPELTDEEKEKLKAAFEARKEAEQARRAELKAKREALKAEGKLLKLRGRERHDERRAALAELRLAKLKQLEARGIAGPALDAAIAATEARAKAGGPGKRIRRHGSGGPAGADARLEANADVEADANAEANADAAPGGEKADRPGKSDDKSTDKNAHKDAHKDAIKAAREAERAAARAARDAEKAAKGATDTLRVPPSGNDGGNEGDAAKTEQ